MTYIRCLTVFFTVMLHERHGVSDQWHLYCLINCLLFVTSKLCNTGTLQWGGPPVTGGFPSQRTSNAENVSMAWCQMWPSSSGLFWRHWRNHVPKPRTILMDMIKEIRNCIVNALELRLSCTNPSTWALCSCPLPVKYRTMIRFDMLVKEAPVMVYIMAWFPKTGDDFIHKNQTGFLYNQSTGMYVYVCKYVSYFTMYSCLVLSHPSRSYSHYSKLNFVKSSLLTLYYWPFVKGIHQSSVTSVYPWQRSVMQKVFPFHDVVMMVKDWRRPGVRLLVMFYHLRLKHDNQFHAGMNTQASHSCLHLGLTPYL